MEKQLLRFFAASTLALLTACGGVVNDQKVAEGLDEYTVVSGSFDQKDPQTLSGSGVARLLSTADSVNSHRTFSMHASFPAQNSAVTVIAFASTTGLGDGIQIRFQRTASNTVTASIYVANAGQVNVRPVQTSKLGTASADFSVEVMNDANNPRVLVWTSDEQEPDTNNAIIDTRVPSHLDGAMPMGNGTGIYLGLRLENATVTRARVRQNFVP